MREWVRKGLGFFIVETSSCIRVNVALSLFKETRGPVPALSEIELSEMSFPRGLPVLVSLSSIGKHVFFPCGAGKCNATKKIHNLMLLRSLYCWNRNSPADLSNHCGCQPKISVWRNSSTGAQKIPHFCSPTLMRACVLKTTLLWVDLATGCHRSK